MNTEKYIVRLTDEERRQLETMPLMMQHALIHSQLGGSSVK